MIRVALNQAKDGLSALLKRAAKEKVLITKHGRPAGVLIGFEDEDDWFDYQIENDPRFKARIARSREQKRRGETTLLKHVEP